MGRAVPWKHLWAKRHNGDRNEWVDGENLS